MTRDIRFAPWTVAAFLGTATVDAQLPPRVPNHPPVVTSTLLPHAAFDACARIDFTFTVSDPDGDAVFARVLSPPHDVIVAPIVNAPSGTSRNVVWYPRKDGHGSDGGRHELVIEAWDSRRPEQKTRQVLAFTVLGQLQTQGVQAADLDGDLDFEILGCAQTATLFGAREGGALAVFDGPIPPSRVMNAPDLWITDPLVDFEYGMARQQIADVTGDGLPDVIGEVRGREVDVWPGGTSGHGNRVISGAVLHSNDPTVEDRFATDSPVLIDDVTNDGILDIVVAFSEANTSKYAAGEILVFEGGASLQGTPAPYATLQVPKPHPGDRLGGDVGPYATGVLIGDVTGDGLVDIVAACPNADSGSTANMGKIYVWSGGAALAGKPTPLATLATSGSVLSDRLGDAQGAQGIHLVDITGDGILDIVASDPNASPGGVLKAGAVFVWNGGPALTGTRDCDAVFTVSNASSYDLLGTSVYADANRQSIQFSDVNRDGIADVVAAAVFANVSGQSFAGAIYVFAGGTASGVVHETATLILASPTSNDRLASAANGLQLVDVTGDGAPDIIESSLSTTTTVSRGGAMHVWAARAGLSGTVFPSATLQDPSASANDAAFGSGPMVADVSGDGVNDIIGASPNVKVISVPRGRMFVWQGGSSLTTGGTPLPLATLLDDPNAGSLYLGMQGTQRPPARIVDFNNDGMNDLVAFAQVGGSYGTDSGRVLTWFGGARLAGTLLPDAAAAAHAGADFFGADGEEIDFADVTGDGAFDLIVRAADASTKAAYDAGAIYLFAGGAGVGGALPVLQKLEDPDGHGYDGFHFYSYTTILFVDVDHDGADDVIVGVPNAWLPWSPEAGKILWYRGPFASQPITPVTLETPPMLGEANLGRGLY